MKTFTDFIHLVESPELEQLDEVTLKTWTSVALTARLVLYKIRLPASKLDPMNHYLIQ